MTLSCLARNLNRERKEGKGSERKKWTDGKKKGREGGRKRLALRDCHE